MERRARPFAIPDRTRARVELRSVLSFARLHAWCDRKLSRGREGVVACGAPGGGGGACRATVGAVRMFVFAVHAEAEVVATDATVDCCGFGSRRVLSKGLV